MFVWPNFKLSFPKQKNQKQNESEKQKKDNSLISRMMPESVVVSMSCLFLTSIDVNPIPDTLILQQGNLGRVDTADNPPYNSCPNMIPLSTCPCTMSGCHTFFCGSDFKLNVHLLIYICSPVFISHHSTYHRR